MSSFWKNWLNIWCLAVMGFGAVLAAAAFEGGEDGVRLFINLINNDMPLQFTAIERFAFGVMGAITFGWGFTLFYFFRAAHASHLGYKMYRQAFLVIVIWNLLDGYISYVTGFRFNIISNLILSLGMFIPLYMSGTLRD